MRILSEINYKKAYHNPELVYDSIPSVNDRSHLWTIVPGLIDILNLYKLSNIYINNTIGDIVLFGTIVDLSKLWKDLFKWFEKAIYN